jgi:hypothetical protein
MVPTEEERLPVRVSISVGGLSAVGRTLSPPLLTSLCLFVYSSFSHLHRDGHASCRAKARTNTPCSLPDNLAH